MLFSGISFLKDIDDLFDCYVFANAMYDSDAGSFF